MKNAIKESAESEPRIPNFSSMDELDATDTAEMSVIINGKPSDWVWIFAGPGHEKTIEFNNRLARERLHRQNQQEQAQVNSKKWKAPEETVDEVRQRNINSVVSRLLGWSPINIGGQEFKFSVENAREFLMDRRKVSFLNQAYEFLSEDSAFTQRSAEN